MRISAKKAFTLIEVLVTMAIIAVLAVFLLPVLGRARESGRRVLCLNNLRQIGVAFYLYLDDNDNCYLISATGTYYGGKTDMSEGVPGRDFSTKPLNSYLSIKSASDFQSFEVFHCPDDTQPMREPDGRIFSSSSAFDTYGTSYQMNNYLTSLISQFPEGVIPVWAITVPHSKTGLLWEHLWYRPGHGGSYGPGSRKVMVLFLDGHASGPYSYNSDFDGSKVIEDLR